MSAPAPCMLASLARQLAAENDVEAVWRRVVDASLAQIDGAEHAGITVSDRKYVSSPFTSDDLVRRIDTYQYTLGQGPCLTAALDRQPIVRADDLDHDPRWPEFRTAATGLGIRSILSFQLYTDTPDSDGHTIGALNIYATKPGAFTDESVRTGTLLATHAALASAAADEHRNLRTALESREIIGQAKGILMERYKLKPEQAFDLLIAASQHTNRKVRDIAADLTTTGELAVV